MRDGVLEWFCFWGNCCVICRLGVSVLRLGWVADGHTAFRLMAELGSKV